MECLERPCECLLFAVLSMGVGVQPDMAFIILFLLIGNSVCCCCCWKSLRCILGYLCKISLIFFNVFVAINFLSQDHFYCIFQVLKYCVFILIWFRDFKVFPRDFLDGPLNIDELFNLFTFFYFLLFHLQLISKFPLWLDRVYEFLFFSLIVCNTCFMCLNTRPSVRLVGVKVLEAAKKNVYSAAFGQTCVDVDIL